MSTWVPPTAEDIAEVKRLGTSAIPPLDRAFLVKLARNPKNGVASPTPTIRPEPTKRQPSSLDKHIGLKSTDYVANREFFGFSEKKTDF